MVFSYSLADGYYLSPPLFAEAPPTRAISVTAGVRSLPKASLAATLAHVVLVLATLIRAEVSDKLSLAALMEQTTGKQEVFLIIVAVQGVDGIHY